MRWMLIFLCGCNYNFHVSVVKDVPLESMKFEVKTQVFHPVEWTQEEVEDVLMEEDVKKVLGRFAGERSNLSDIPFGSKVMASWELLHSARGKVSVAELDKVFLDPDRFYGSWVCFSGTVTSHERERGFHLGEMVDGLGRGIVFVTGTSWDGEGATFCGIVMGKVASHNRCALQLDIVVSGSMEKK